jgi:predicted methyltransferase MtxX (methanogen marker protein 4)
MLTSETIFSGVQNKHARIGIGVGADRQKVVRSKAEAERAGFDGVALYDDPIQLAEDLKEGKLDAAVRGDLDSNKAMAAVRRVAVEVGKDEAGRSRALVRIAVGVAAVVSVAVAALAFLAAGSIGGLLNVPTASVRAASAK